MTKVHPNIMLLKRLDPHNPTAAKDSISDDVGWRSVDGVWDMVPGRPSEVHDERR